MLAFDLRGHGESEGDRFSLGQHERWDVAAAIDFLATLRTGTRRAPRAVDGRGDGAADSRGAARRRSGHRDSGYSDGRAVVEEVATRYTGLPTWFTPGIILAARLFELDVDQIEPAAIIPAHPEHAFLIIHCSAHNTVPPHHGPDLAASSANPGTHLWLAPGCGHTKALDAYPLEYAARVVLAANMP